MQSTLPSDTAKDIAQRLISLDPVEFDSAINEYFEADASIDTQALHVSGASRIKKLAQWQSGLAVESSLVGEPIYDEKTHAVNFIFKRTYKAPLIPAYVPFSEYLSGKERTMHYTAKLIVAPGVTLDGPNLVVQKVANLDRVEKLPLDSFVPFALLRPLFSLVALFLATLSSFYTTHKKEGPFRISVSAAEEVFFALWGSIMFETEKRKAQAEVWTSQKGEQIDHLYVSAQKTGEERLRDLEHQADAADMTLLEYMKRARAAAEQAKVQADSAVKYAGAKAIEAKETAAEATQMALGVPGFVQAKVGEVYGGIQVRVEEVRVGVQNKVGEVKLGVQNTVGGVVGEASTRADQVRAELYNRGGQVERAIRSKADEARRQAGEVVNGVREVGAAAQNTAGAAIDRASYAAIAGRNKAAEINGAVYNKAGELISTAQGVASDAANAAINTASDINGAVYDKAGQLVSAAQDTAGQATGVARDAAGAMINKAGEINADLQDKAGAVAEQVGEVKGGVDRQVDFMKDQYYEGKQVGADKVNVMNSDTGSLAEGSYQLDPVVTTAVVPAEVIVNVDGETGVAVVPALVPVAEY